MSSAKDGLVVDVSVGNEQRSRVLTSPRRRARVPIYKKVSRRQCPLIDYTWERQWTRVVERCHSHPHEASCVSDFSGRTALHLASFNQGCPNFVANALITANPHALIKQDSYGQTPLHYACQFRGGTNDLVLIYCDKLVDLASRGMDVLNACPAVTASPLYLACARNAPIQVLKALIVTRTKIGVCWMAPVTGAEPYWKDDNTIHVLHGNGEHGTTTPLSVLLESCEQVLNIGIDSEQCHEMRSVALRVLSASCEEETVDRFIEDKDDNEDSMSVWLKCLVLLRQEHLEYARDNNGASLLHLIAALKVPLPLMMDVCTPLFHEEALRRDSRGLHPLHYALLNPNSVNIFLKLLRSQLQAATFAFPNGQSTLVVALQQQNLPYPLLEELVMADPDALTQRDSETGFLPFQLAASLDSDETTIHGLLRMRPDLLLLSS